MKFGETMVVNGQLYLLQNWRAQVAKAQNGTGRAIVGFAGDSWPHLNPFLDYLRDRMQAQYGYAGAGWIGVVPVGNMDAPTGVVITKTGAWEDTVNNAIVGTGVANPSIGPSLRHTRITEVADQQFTVTAPVSSFVIHYWRQPGGGEYRYKVDDGNYTTISTSADVAEYATETVGGLWQIEDSLLTIEPVTAGGAGIILVGVDCQKSGSGVVVHNLGSGSAKSRHYPQCNTASFAAGLAALGIHTFALEIGTNEMSGSLNEIAAYQTTLINNVLSVDPLIDILLIPSADNGRDGAIITGAYAARMARTAYDNKCAFFSLWDWIGPYSKNRNLYDWTTTHLNADGQRVAANLLYKHVFEI
jgi:hypothetical protein